MAAETSIKHPNILSPLPEQSSLRYILQKRFANGMKEDSIAFILKDILKGLSYLHDQHLIGHKNVNARQISVRYNAKNHAISIELTLNRATDCVMPQFSFETAPNPTEGIWDLGIMALELGYGSLPRNSTPEKLATLAANVLKILKPHLEIKGHDHLEEEEKAKGKGKEAINPDEGKGKRKKHINQEEKDPIHQEKRKGKVKESINQKETEDTIDQEKGKGKVKESINQKETEDTIDQEKGKGKGKEPINQEETEELKMIKMPPQLEQLLDDKFVKRLEEKLLVKKKKEDDERAKGKKKKKQNKVVGAIKESMNFVGENILRMKDDRKEFSKDFLEVLMRSVDQKNPFTAAQIMQLKFFKLNGVTIEMMQALQSIKSRALL